MRATGTAGLLLAVGLLCGGRWLMPLVIPGAILGGGWWLFKALWGWLIGPAVLLMLAAGMVDDWVELNPSDDGDGWAGFTVAALAAYASAVYMTQRHWWLKSAGIMLGLIVVLHALVLARRRRAAR